MEINKGNYYKSILILCLTFMSNKEFPNNINFNINMENTDLLSSYVDILTDVFCQYGLKENDEPNACGLILEDTIDYFNNLIYKLDLKQ